MAPNRFTLRQMWRSLALGLLTILIIVGVPCLLEAIAPAPGYSITASSPKDAISSPRVGESDPRQWLEQGRGAYQAGQFTQAIALWQQAALAFQILGDRPQQASSLSNLALAYHQLGQWREANQAISQSLALVDGSNITTPAVLAQALMAQGKLQLSQGQAETALATWRRAMVAYQRAGDRLGEARSLMQQAQALRVLGLYPQAQQTLAQVMQTWVDQPSSPMKAAVLWQLGDLLRLTGDLPQAKQALQQSLAIYQQQAKAPSDGKPPLAAELKSNLAAVQLSLGNIAYAQLLKLKHTNPEQRSELIRAFKQEAWKDYEQASLQAPNEIARLQAQLNQLRLLIDLNARSEAAALITQLVPQLLELPPTRNTIYARVDLAQNWLKLVQQPPSSKSLGSATRLATAQLTDQLRPVADLLAIALKQARELGDLQAESYALGYLGKLYQQQQQWAEAQPLTEKALWLAQTIRATEVAYRWQWQLAELQAQQGNRPKAIQAYDEAIQSLSRLRQELVGSNLDLQFSFRERVEPIYRQFVELLLSRQGETSQADLKQARQVIESLQLAELDNFFQEACLTTAQVAIDQIDPHTAVFYPIILPDRLEVILALPNQPLRHYTQVIAQADLEAKLAQMRRSFRLTSTQRERLAIAQELYNWLIRPAEPALVNSPINTLTFILDGSLRRLPMATLHDGQRYLIERYNLGLSPGLQLRSPIPLLKPQLKVLLGGITESRQEFSALPGVGIEVADIDALLPAQVLLNQQLTAAALQQQVQATPFPVVHLATHGQFSSDAENTFILTWDGRVNAKQLGDLLRQRQLGDRQPIELLVLSACQTAQGDTRAALGLAGLAVRSGARSTLASLWPVDDQSTTLLMTQFYQQLMQPGITKAEALRQAQLGLLRGTGISQERTTRSGIDFVPSSEMEDAIARRAARKFSHPYYWAAFVLVGDWL
jgi:CHAT domain-containing protein